MKRPDTKLTGKAKKTLISVSAGAAAVAIVAGIAFGSRGRREPVGVYPFSMVGMTEFWGDNQESYGPVTTDRIQTVYLSDTQTITGVKVKEGDTVKKGDVLMTYDTTLSELELERKRLDVEKAKLQVKEAQEELARINAMKPMGDVDISLPVEGTDWGETIQGDYTIVTKDDEFDGSSPEKAVVCWLKDTTPVNNALLRELYYRAMMNQIANAEKTPSSGSALPDTGKGNTQEEQLLEEEKENTDTSGQDEDKENTDSSGLDEENKDADAGNSEENTEGNGGDTGNRENDPNETGDGENQTQETPSQPPEPDAFTLFAMRAPESLQIYCGDVYNGGIVQVTSGDAVNLTFTSSVTDWEHSNYVTWSLTSNESGPLMGQRNGRGYTVSGVTSTIGETEYTVKATYNVEDLPTLDDIYTFKLRVVAQPAEEEEERSSFYTILKITEGNLEKAPCTTWQGLKVTAYDGGGFGFSFCDVPGQDVFFPEDTDDDSSFPDIDFGSGMTAAEIAKLRREQEKKIKELTASAKMTESEYNLMVREFSDGNIRATLDGVVVSLMTEEESRQNKLPIMKVSGGGGFYVQGSVSELEKDRLKVGQEVSINDWNTGGVYTGTVESIGDFPVQGEGWNGIGNPNASYYPFRVFIDGTADLQEGSYVSVTYSAAEAENGVYLENPFLRTDDGDPYVYVRGRNGKLEKRAVTTGKSLWGSYTEIRSGLSADDYVAFPYGKNVKPGAATVESDLSALYGY